MGAFSDVVVFHTRSFFLFCILPVSGHVCLVLPSIYPLLADFVIFFVASGPLLHVHSATCCGAVIVRVRNASSGAWVTL